MTEKCGQEEGSGNTHFLNGFFLATVKDDNGFLALTSAGSGTMIYKFGINSGSVDLGNYSTACAKRMQANFLKFGYCSGEMLGNFE